MTKEKYLKLLSKRLSGNISNAERTALDHASGNNDQYEQISNKLEGYLQRETQAKINSIKLKQTWDIIAKTNPDQFEERFDYGKPKTTLFSSGLILKIAAMLILVAGLGFVTTQLLRYRDGQGFLEQTATTQKEFLLLEDGSSVWLNKQSSIRYTRAFGKQKREIFLKGEAYFDVAKNPHIPLFIHVGNLDIKVKGTAFNVNAYKEHTKIQVALVRGLIEVTNRLDRNYKAVLKPNDKLVFEENSSIEATKHFSVEPVDSKVLFGMTRWTADTLQFQKEKLKDLAIRMEKKYGMKIQVSSVQLKEKRFSGTFIDETIHQALEALKLSYPFNYTISNRSVLIKD
jgi:transmembrane sensor